MQLGKFIKNFSHNNLIRLVYKNKSGHEVVSDNWNDVSMDWQVNKGQGKFRHFVDNEVIGIASISFDPKEKGLQYPEAINIIIERLENQPIIPEKIEEKVNNTVSVEPSNVHMNLKEFLHLGGDIEKLNSSNAFLNKSLFHSNLHNSKIKEIKKSLEKNKDGELYEITFEEDSVDNPIIVNPVWISIRIKSNEFNELVKKSIQ